MTQEHKDLLLKDLCARLPYGVKCNIGNDKPYTLSRIEIDDKNGHLLDFIETKDGLDMQVYLSEVKPYLFPLSNIKEVQKIIYSLYIDELKRNDGTYFETTFESLEFWLNVNHFDYRGLIPMGLAIDATELNIY